MPAGYLTAIEGMLNIILAAGVSAYESKQALV